MVLGHLCAIANIGNPKSYVLSTRDIGEAAAGCTSTRGLAPRLAAMDASGNGDGQRTFPTAVNSSAKTESRLARDRVFSTSVPRGFGLTQPRSQHLNRVGPDLK